MAQPNHIPGVRDSASQQNSSVMTQSEKEQEREYTVLLSSVAHIQCFSSSNFPAVHSTKVWVQEGPTPCLEELT